MEPKPGKDALEPPITEVGAQRSSPIRPSIQHIAIHDDNGQEINFRSQRGPRHTQRLFTSVLGMNVARLHVTIQLSAPHNAILPEKLKVVGRIRDPRSKSSSHTRLPFKATARRKGGLAKSYVVDVPLTKLSKELWKDRTPEVSTIVREHGQSDQHFRGPLTSVGWKVRGTAVQPDRGKPDVTGDVIHESPDALTLLKAGGVEVLELSVDPDFDGNSSSLTTWAFIRSPTDVVFYSGHGGWWNGRLLRGTPFEHQYSDWIGPEELLQSWGRKGDLQRSPMDIDVLVINGCSVLFWNHKNDKTEERRGSYGLKWAELLAAKKGPLFAILGYRATAPIDQPWGNRIANRFGEALKGGIQPDGYARRWMEINASQNLTWTAAAWDRHGYYYINAIGYPGYYSSKAAGEIIGPIPFP